MLYLNFDGGDVAYGNDVQHVSAFVPQEGLGRDQEIQDIINLVAQIYAPFNVQVQQITGFGNYDGSSNGNTTIFIGPNPANAGNGVKYASSSTPFMFVDAPGPEKGYNHAPNSDPYDLAFVDPYSANSMESESQIAAGIAHEAGHTFGLEHVLTGDGSGTWSDQNAPDIMSYDAPNQNFLNQAFPITDLNYNPAQGGNYHGGDHFFPQWNFNGTIQSMQTQNSYTYLLAVLGPHS
jgi:hypothetical protein